MQRRRSCSCSPTECRQTRTPEDVVAIADQLKSRDVTVVSCWLTSDTETEKRKLYAKAQPQWSEGARLMFDVASPLPTGSAFHEYLIEHRWTIDPGAALFAEVDQSEELSEFLTMTLSPTERRYRPTPHDPGSPVRVFVSYSHRDAEYLRPDSLLGRLTGLRREGFEFWTDQDDIIGSDPWEARIRTALERADIVLALVTPDFLNSPYCQDQEIRLALEARRRRDAFIYPIIMSPCDWQSFSWLAEIEHRPRGKDVTVETQYTTRGARDQFFLEVLRELREIGERVRSRTS